MKATTGPWIRTKMCLRFQNYICVNAAWRTCQKSLTSMTKMRRAFLLFSASFERVHVSAEHLLQEPGHVEESQAG